ncbi:Gfo/Idh/MocA family protein [Saccharopolyspora gloriosae]|uniref:Gfo/Idh/MocA family protein n=1 Tax=Saccharopolyspora gloriosae TaxID=455344 RepID=UPI001FB5F66F|nr:Gfo/Idh/MocA family oxidoreductase [Saccharopolyspora gloriosae]
MSGVDNSTVSVGVLGCADIAARRVLPAFATAPGAEITAIASRSADKARALAARFTADPVEGYQRLLDRADVDAVYLPLPSGLHAEWIERALRAGKHVLAEKPLTTSPEDTSALQRLAADLGLVLEENFMFRHHGQHAVVRALLDEGVVGRPRAFSAAFAIPSRPRGDIRYQAELGGGALLDVAGYPVAAAQLLFGPDWRVEGAFLKHEPEFGVDVAGTALLSTPAGPAATLIFGLEHHYGSRYEIWGDAGRLAVDHVFTTPAAHRPVVRIERADHQEERVLPAEDQVSNAVRAFLRAVRRGSAHGTRATGVQADLLEAIRHAARPVSSAPHVEKQT